MINTESDSHNIKLAKIYNDSFHNNFDILHNVIEYLFLETFTKRKITIIILLRIFDKMVKLDQFNALKKFIFENIKSKLKKLISSIKKYDINQQNLFPLLVWLENIFTKNYDLQIITSLNSPLIYDYKLEISPSICHELFIPENNNSPSRKFYNDLFLFSRFGYFIQRNYVGTRNFPIFKKMYYYFYSQSPFASLKQSKTFSIKNKESFPAQIKLKINGTFHVIDV